MIPLVDTHCHLLAGLDDGPRTMDDAVRMCRIAWEDGIRAVAATAHLSELWPEVTPARIRAAVDGLRAALKAIMVLPYDGEMATGRLELDPDLVADCEYVSTWLSTLVITYRNAKAKWDAIEQEEANGETQDST